MERQEKWANVREGGCRNVTVPNRTVAAPASMGTATVWSLSGEQPSQAAQLTIRAGKATAYARTRAATPPGPPPGGR